MKPQNVFWLVCLVVVSALIFVSPLPDMVWNKAAAKLNPTPTLPTMVQTQIQPGSSLPTPAPAQITRTYVVGPNGTPAPLIEVGPVQVARPTFVPPPVRWTTQAIPLGEPQIDEKIVNCALPVTKQLGDKDLADIFLASGFVGIDKRIYLTVIVEPRFYIQQHQQMSVSITYEGNQPTAAKISKIRMPRPQIRFGKYIQDVYPYSPETWLKDLSGLREQWNANRMDAFTILMTDGVLAIGREMETARPQELGGLTLREFCEQKLKAGVTVTMFENITRLAYQNVPGATQAAQALLTLNGNGIANDISFDAIEWVNVPWMVVDKEGFTPKKPAGW